MNGKPWYDAFQEIESSVVKIITPQGSGTGFLIASTSDKEYVGIATAAHVLEFAHYWEHPLRIEHFKSGKTIYLQHSDRYIDINYDRDIASIVILGDKLPFATDLIPLLPEGKRLKVGVEIGWMGFPAISPNNLCFFTGVTSCWVEKDGFYFVDGVAINGVSGGPTFYIEDGKNVKIIGIVSAYIPNRATGAVLPGLCVVRDIMPLYKTINDLKSFEDAKKMEKKPEPPPPAPTPAIIE
jgi:hypothetical protein